MSLEWPAGTPAIAPQVHIQAVRAVGPTRDSLPMQADVGPGGVVLDLGDGIWLVQATAPGYWSQETEVAVTRQEGTVRLALWPEASLRGQILTSGDESPPSALNVQLRAVPRPDRPESPQTPGLPPSTALPRAELTCLISQRTWSCLAPAGFFDLRIEAAGFAPSYRWGVSLEAGVRTDLGRTDFRRAASVFGRAVRKDGSDPPGPCKATLQPDLEWRSGPDADPVSLPANEPGFSVPLSSQGYFQVVGVQPGRHLLAVACSAATAFRELIVQADAETQVDPPLQLEDETLEIALTPAIDPDGRPWTLTVDATSPHLRRIADKAATSPDGHWIRRGLVAGTYRVLVTGADGTQWLQKDFDLRAGSGPLSLRLAFVRVAGQVRLSTRPVRARLIFFNRVGGEPTTLKSDDDGCFHGLLPAPFGAKETTWSVEAHLVRPPSTRRIADVNVPMVSRGSSAWLDLELPAIAVRGTVISEGGQPQRGSPVTFEDSNGVRTTTSTDDAGSFEMADLSPGNYTAMAESDDGSSDRAPFDVVDGNEKELKLIVHPSLRVAFNVVSNQGPVSDAAVQVWIAPGVPRAFSRTDKDGRFVVKLPPGTTQVGMTVGAPGYALKLTRMPVSSGTDPSGNANTITLDSSSGALVVNFESPSRVLDNSTTLYLVHNGAIQDARTIADWGTEHAGTSGDGPAVVDAIEPGSYALCLLAEPSQLAALWNGALPSDLCRAGSVDQGQTLTLKPQ